MIDWKEISDGETWELFSRDVLAELGFVIEIGPGRGADAGRDLLVSEQLSGKLNTRPYRWLVSCKHFAVSGKSVTPDVEANITDRLRQHSADGFIGFYSTLASAALVERLNQYSDKKELGSVQIFDGRRIEALFVSTGMSKIALRYFPKSYGQMRPIQKLLGELVQLRCDICDADILTRSVQGHAKANLVWVVTGEAKRYEKLYVVCAGDCDRKIQDRVWANNQQITVWESVNDLCNPVLYLKNMLTYMNQLHQRRSEFSDEAHDRMKEVYVALAQRTLREVTQEDFERFKSLRILDNLPI